MQISLHRDNKVVLYCYYVSKCSVNGNSAPVIRFVQFHYCTVSNPGTGADDAFVLKRGV